MGNFTKPMSPIRNRFNLCSVRALKDNSLSKFLRCDFSVAYFSNVCSAQLLWSATVDVNKKKNKAFIDTIGEGAGVYSRLQELEYHGAYSCKYSEGASGLSDITGEYKFANMRSYLYWCLRDWLNPKNNFEPALPPCDKLMEEATETHWKFQSNGSIIIEPKDDIKKRIKRSPDYFDALANTFYPHDYMAVSNKELLEDFL